MSKVNKRKKKQEKNEQILTITKAITLYGIRHNLKWYSGCRTARYRKVDKSNQDQIDIPVDAWVLNNIA